MMQGMIQTSLRLRFLVVAIAAALVFLGIGGLRDMPVDVLPEYAPPSVEIQTESLGLSAEEVEQLITVPMEQDLLNGIPWIDTIHSESVPGLSSITMVFLPGTDLMRARQMVAERMTQAVALPHVSKPPTMLQPHSATSRVMIVGISSKQLSLIQLGVLARWTIAPRLLGVPGVANVAVWGQRDRQLQVLVDPQRLTANNVPLVDVLETTGNALWVSTLSFVEASTPGTGGFIDTPNQRLGIRHISPIITPQGLAQIPISDRKKSDGTPLVLSDVANVVEDHQPLIGDAISNEGTGLLLVIEKSPGTNTLEVTQGVESALQQLQPGLPGVTIDTTIYRPASFIEQGIANVTSAMLIGYLLLVLALGLLYWNWRTALISALAIPLSLVAAAYVLYLRGATMNVMLVAGFAMAIAVVVGDAIIGVENVLRRLRQSRDEANPKPRATIILEASSEARRNTFFSMVVGALALVPIFILAGLSEPFFQPMVVAYGLGMVAAMAVALLVTPGLCLILMANAPVQRGESPVVRGLQRAFGAALAGTMRRPRFAFAALAGLMIIGLAALPFLGRSSLPNFKERDLIVQLKAVPGTSQPEMSRITGLVGNELRSIAGVRSVGAHIGRAVLGDQVVGANSAELWVKFDATADYDRTVAAIEQVAAAYPGLHTTVQTYLQESSRDAVVKPTDSLVVRVYGDTDELLRKSAEDVQRAMTGIPGIYSSRIDLPVQQLTVETEVDIAAASRYGLKPGDVRRAAATLLSGVTVGSLFEESKVFDVVVWSTPETRHSLNSINDLLIDTPDGGSVRLGDVAKVRMAPTPNVIRHEAVKRYVDVTAAVSGRDMAAVATDVKARLRDVQFPLEYHAQILGDYSAQQASQFRTLGFGIAALVAILILLQAALGSWRLAGLTFLASLAALAGGLVAAILAGGWITLGSLAGLVVVFGITARNGMMLINHSQHLERQGEAFGPGLALRGARERLSSTLTMALATALAFAPVLFMGDVPGFELLRPMAAVIVGGLFTSTLLNALIVPSIYLRLGVRSEPELEVAEAPEAAQKGRLGDLPNVTA